MEINLTGDYGTTKIMHSIPQDSYKAKIIDISDPFITQGYEEGDKEREKICIVFEVDADGQEVEITEGETVTKEKKAVIPLSMYCTTQISKGSGKYSNSKLFDVLSILDLLKQFEIDAPAINGESDVFVKWFKEKTKDMEVKVMVKNSKEKKFSRVSEINRLIKNPNIIPEEKVGV